MGKQLDRRRAAQRQYQLACPPAKALCQLVRRRARGLCTADTPDEGPKPGDRGSAADVPDAVECVVANLDRIARIERNRKQPVEVRGVTGSLYAAEDGSQVLLVWAEGEIFYTIAGDLTAEQALTIAESLK